MPDMPDMQLYLEKMSEVAQVHLQAVSRQIGAEPAHLEKLSIEEDNMNAEDEQTPDDEAKKAEIMGKHKAASPFALDVAAARARLIEAMKE
tara:strand:- start:1872 stop:2144 length:273 start_codon:yes stop_codon:yes gene_type:complete